MDHLYFEKHLAKHTFLMGDTYTVADAYLFTILSWAPMVKFDLAPWKGLMGYAERVKSRPATQAVLRAEGLIKS